MGPLHHAARQGPSMTDGRLLSQAAGRSLGCDNLSVSLALLTRSRIAIAPLPTAAAWRLAPRPASAVAASGPSAAVAPAVSSPRHLAGSVAAASGRPDRTAGRRPPSSGTRSPGGRRAAWPRRRGGSGRVVTAPCVVRWFAWAARSPASLLNTVESYPAFFAGRICSFPLDSSTWIPAGKHLEDSRCRAWESRARSSWYAGAGPAIGAPASQALREVLRDICLWMVDFRKVA